MYLIKPYLNEIKRQEKKIEKEKAKLAEIKADMNRMIEANKKMENKNA